jgi:D-inositol-3-phosphate glycosyltransferase
MSARRSRVASVALPALGRVRRRSAGVPFGIWEHPHPGGLIPGERVAFTGWALPGRHGGAAHIQVLCEERVVGATLALQPRADVARVYGLPALESGWTVEVDLADASAGAAIEVVVQDGRARQTLGRGRVAPSTPPATDAFPAAATGAIDRPLEGELVEGAVLPVWGWCTSGGEVPDVVEIYIDDAAPVRARRCDPRLDLPHAVPARPAVAVAAGFSELVPLRRALGRRFATVRVDARFGGGAVWQSRPVTVRLAGDDEPWAGAAALPSPFRSRGSRPASGRLRVLAIVHSLRLGGGELYLQELLRRLTDDGIAEFRVISPEDGPLRGELEAAGIGVHVTAPYEVSPVRYAARLAELTALIESWGCDVAIANTLGVFPAVDAALESGVPVLWAVHESFDLDVFAYLNWGARGLHPSVHERWLAAMRRATLVFEADATRRMFEQAVPGLSGRHIPYGIDLAAVSAYEQAHDRDAARIAAGFAPDDRMLLCMGVFQERKAQLALVHAFAAAAPVFPDAKLVLVGEHPSSYAQAIRVAVADFGLGARVRIEAIAADTYRWYRSADVLVSASDTESLPRSVLESQAFGVPVLAADVFGVCEVVTDGVTGWLCRARDGESLLAGLRRALTATDAELTAMSARCRAGAADFDGAGYAKAYAELIHEAHDQRSARPPR